MVQMDLALMSLSTWLECALSLCLGITIEVIPKINKILGAAIKHVALLFLIKHFIVGFKLIFSHLSYIRPSLLCALQKNINSCALHWNLPCSIITIYLSASASGGSLLRACCMATVPTGTLPPKAQHFFKRYREANCVSTCYG